MGAVDESPAPNSNLAYFKPMRSCNLQDDFYPNQKCTPPRKIRVTRHPFPLIAINTGLPIWRSAARAITGIASAIALVGCATGPAFKSPEAAPADQALI